MRPLTSEGGRAALVTFRLDRRAAARLDDLAAARGRLRSEELRRAVDAHLAAEEAATA